MGYGLRTTSTVRRALSESQPEAVAAADYEFFQLAPLLLDRIGSGSGCFLRWTTGLARRGTYRVICRIDDKARVVTVVDVAYRRDVYRT